MAIRKRQLNTNTFYFSTITCYKWLPLIEITNLYDHIYNWFDLLKSKKVKITGYVIMPNHMHLLLFTMNNTTNINSILGTGKRFMAYEIVRRLNNLNRKKVIKELQASVNPNDKLEGKLHNVFEPSFDLKEIATEKFIVQKLNYIHANPVRGKWNLADDFRNYEHSSAGFYELGIENCYGVVHYSKALE